MLSKRLAITKSQKIRKSKNKHTSKHDNDSDFIIEYPEKESQPMPPPPSMTDSSCSSTISDVEDTIPNIEKNQISQKKWIKISLCLPDSLLEKSQSHELQAYMVSQIARTACIFCVDEIIILEDKGYKKKSENFQPSHYIAKNLEYLETPQYLRKALFPLSSDLKFAGLMAPLESQHHLKTEDYCQYREGVVLDRPSKPGEGSWVDVGLYKQVKITEKIPAKTRITVKINETYSKGDYFKNLGVDLTGNVVSQNEPKEKLGLYWGYRVRVAEKFHHIFTECPYQGGYDFQILVDPEQKNDLKTKIQEIPEETDEKINHILVFISPINGLKSLIEADEQSKANYSKILPKFSLATNIISGIGVKSLWIDEKVVISLNILNDHFRRIQYRSLNNFAEQIKPLLLLQYFMSIQQQQQQQNKCIYGCAYINLDIFFFIFKFQISSKPSTKNEEKFYLQNLLELQFNQNHTFIEIQNKPQHFKHFFFFSYQKIENELILVQQQQHKKKLKQEQC